MTLDAAIASLPEVLAALRRIEQRVERIEASVTTPAPAPLETLAGILGCTADAARRRLSRDAELRRLGVRAGRSLVFRRDEVLAFYAARSAGTKPAPLRVVGEGA